MNSLIFIGIMLVIFGISIFIDPIFYSYKYNFTFDFTTVKLPFSSLLIGTGIYSVWAAVTNKKKISEFHSTLICLKCMVPTLGKDLFGSKCPTCKSEMEPISGFFERHPELKPPPTSNTGEQNEYNIILDIMESSPSAAIQTTVIIICVIITSVFAMLWVLIKYFQAS